MPKDMNGREIKVNHDVVFNRSGSLEFGTVTKIVPISDKHHYYGRLKTHQYVIHIAIGDGVVSKVRNEKAIFILD